MIPAPTLEPSAEPRLITKKYADYVSIGSELYSTSISGYVSNIPIIYHNIKHRDIPNSMTPNWIDIDQIPRIEPCAEISVENS